MSLRIAPPALHPTSTDNTTGRIGTANSLTAPHPSKGAPSAPGLPDRLRDNITLAPKDAPSTSTTTISPSSTHPLESRLLAWRATQEAMKMESLRRTFGMAEPIRRGMELKIVREGNMMPMMLSQNRGFSEGGRIHEDILVLGGRDTELGWEDVFTGDEYREPPSFHDEMEKRLKMDW